jgi:hypothetical protein
VKEEEPERLVEAARRAVEEVKGSKMQDEWCAPLPDAFRWLRMSGTPFCSKTTSLLVRA